MTQAPEHDTFAPDVLEALSAVAPAAWINTAWVDTMTAMGSELAAFVADRVREDIELQQALLRCKSLSEVPHVQAAFLQKALDQYQAETGKLIEMTGKMAAELHPAPKAG